MIRKNIFLLAGLVFALAFIGCSSKDAAMEEPAVTKAIAVLHPTEGNEVHGTVWFEQEDGGVRVTAEIMGLEVGSRHGFHVHEFGDCSAADGTSAGGHFNPAEVDHGGPSDMTRHVGDMGNLVVGEDGIGRVDYVDPMISLSGETSVLGRGLIVHAGEDDLASQPTGAAGARVACGVIGIANDAME